MKNLGKQTRVTKKVLNESSKIKGKGLKFILNALKYIKENYKKVDAGSYGIVPRERLVDEIIKSKVMTGCTDYAHLFISLCKSRKIPAIYLEALNNEWIKNPDLDSIRGHIFVEIEIEGIKLHIDPTHGIIHTQKRFNNYSVIEKGEDFLSIFPNQEINKKRIKEFLDNNI